MKIICDCGSSGDMEDLEKIEGKVGTELRCPVCKSSSGLHFVKEDSDGIPKDIEADEKPGNYKTTTENFELFKKCVGYWLKFYGLYGWDLRFLHQEDDDSLAYTSYNILNRSASVILAKEWDRPVTDRELDKIAFHEVGEVLLLRLRHIAEARFISDEETGEEIHNIIRILENVIWKPKMDNFVGRVSSAEKIASDTIEACAVKMRNDFM
jgi:hypothetical protein